ncbi:Uncharacterized protein PBTT_00749 [Plasmodiophora brassicae]|uniref:Uncharacterized protein n=2 Tax=Plasmodiophora brassicae TaxID=37360 RepID=A0A3P3XZ10_PLABS|nr:unnamed protein product [Plasmodiophora brassicae]
MTRSDDALVQRLSACGPGSLYLQRAAADEGAHNRVFEEDEELVSRSVENIIDHATDVQGCRHVHCQRLKYHSPTVAASVLVLFAFMLTCPSGAMFEGVPPDRIKVTSANRETMMDLRALALHKMNPFFQATRCTVGEIRTMMSGVYPTSDDNNIVYKSTLAFRFRDSPRTRIDAIVVSILEGSDEYVAPEGEWASLTTECAEDARLIRTVIDVVDQRFRSLVAGLAMGSQEFALAGGMLKHPAMKSRFTLTRPGQALLMQKYVFPHVCGPGTPYKGVYAEIWSDAILGRIKMLESWFGRSVIGQVKAGDLARDFETGKLAVPGVSLERVRSYFDGVKGHGGNAITLFLLPEACAKWRERERGQRPKARL